jgi:hypothetical protein
VQEVVDAARARGRALAAQDWAAVEAALHSDFVYVNAQGIRLGRDDYLGFVRHGPLRWREQRLQDVEVVVEEPVAVLTALVIDDVLVDGEPCELRFFTTQTYVRGADGWLYLAGQTGPVSDA